MGTPSERLWAERAAWNDDSGPVLGDPALAPLRIVDIAARVADGTELRAAVADFLDDLRWVVDQRDVSRRIDEEPQRLDPRADAYLAAVAEHVAGLNRVRVPAWSRGSSRFLDHFWWPSRTVGLHARALVESPAAFRRRGIFIGRTTLRRV